MNKVDKYISVVTVINNQYELKYLDQVVNSLKQLSATYSFVEFIFVVNINICEFLIDKSNFENLTIITLSHKHSYQKALSAGIDASIGDFVYEVTHFSPNFDYANKFDELFKEVNLGNDFVFLKQKKKHFLSSILFKSFRKRYKKFDKYDFFPSLLSVSSRRGINKVSTNGDIVVNRNVSYLLTGLKHKNLVVRETNYKNKSNILDLVHEFLDTAIFYTNLISKSILFFTLINAIVFLPLIFVLFGYSMESLFLTILIVGFSILMVISSFIIKYLHHILFKSIGKKSYTFSNMDRS